MKNIWGIQISFCGGGEKRRRNVFGELVYGGEGKGGKYLKKENVFFVLEKEKEENIWRRNYS